MFKSRSRLVIGVVLFFLLAFIAVEITLRKGWGLGSMLLYTEDDAFEYIAKPNQDNVRFGNRIISNDYSMRSLPLNEDDSCTVLGFGDSVINGGVLTDQDSLATTLVENQLQSEDSHRVRFLNISAGSWGPDNCAAYLNKYGSFNAKMIILFVSSHDAHDNMTFEKIVGVHPSYPEKQYPLAVAELIGRYVWPRLVAMLSKDNNGTAENLMINKGGIEFNPGFDFFKDFTQKNEIPFLVCLHAEKIEVEAGQFNTQGDEILKYCLENRIKVISGLEIGEDVNDFRDTIHLNEKGQKRWAKVLLKEIQGTIKSCL